MQHNNIHVHSVCLPVMHRADDKSTNYSIRARFVEKENIVQTL